jgi:hypothetical protein
VSRLTAYYVEILRPNGGTEFFRYRCETGEQAQAFARRKAADYGGRVAQCRVSLVQDGPAGYKNHTEGSVS